MTEINIEKIPKWQMMALISLVSFLAVSLISIAIYAYNIKNDFFMDADAKVAEKIQRIEEKQDKFNDSIAKVDSRLSRIEGALGIKENKSLNLKNESGTIISDNQKNEL